MRLRNWATPERLQRQKEGDFPLQLRPSGEPPQTQDLQDRALDAFAAEGDDIGHRGPKPKPHRIREAIMANTPGSSRQTGSPFDNGSTATVDQIREKRAMGDASKVEKLNPERDMSEEDAAAVRAQKARTLAKRQYKWMPNPFGPKPGPLGDEAKYFDKYFDGQQPIEDPSAEAPGGSVDQELREGGVVRHRRERISPAKFWYKPDYITPDPPSVAMMNSRELKFAMVNEAHLVRKWRDAQPEGRAAGLPPQGPELWLAFGLRAAEVAHVDRPANRATQSQETEDVALDAMLSEGRRPPQKCSLSTMLRFLQAMASVQAGPHSAILGLMSSILDSLQDLKPNQCFFLLQAMSRLRIKHPKSMLLLQRMSLAWRTLTTKKLVKAANAVAKLDIGGHLWAKPLKVALVRTLPQMPWQHFTNLKSIAVMELLDDPDSLRVYLENAERLRSYVWYSRHVQVVELHVHLVYPDLWASLDEQLRLFMQQVREAALQSREGDRQAASLTSEAASGSESDGSDSETLSGDSDSDSESAPSWKRAFDRQRFSSALHEDVSRVLGQVLGVEHHNKLEAGAMTVDMCHVPTMTVVEAAARWQYYVRSPHFTALARRRQELLRAMGFKLVLVPYHRWDMLANDEDKATFLSEKLPPELKPSLTA